MKISKLRINPDNPRLIKDTKFENLVLNILKYPQFLTKRPIVYKDAIIQGGNMRFRAVKHLINMKEEEFNALCHLHKMEPELHQLWLDIRKNKAIPDEWTANAEDYTEEQLKAFIILDNVSAGENDWEKLANEWDMDKLADWGMNVAGWKNENVNQDLLPIDANPAEPGTKTVTFEVATGAKPPELDTVVYEQIMRKENKIELLGVLNQVKEKEGVALLEDALMIITRFYKNNHK